MLKLNPYQYYNYHTIQHKVKSDDSFNPTANHQQVNNSKLDLISSTNTCHANKEFYSLILLHDFTQLYWINVNYTIRIVTV